ncbi:MAG TPA: hypothetical protein VHT75_07085 [Acidimicrobiales bacterium]|nr:hypothetical protein [Acidimicrobiales bacterium]
MDSRLTRRTFLLGAAAAGVAACSKNAVIHVPQGNAAQLNLLLTSGATDGASAQAISTYEAGSDQRVAFVLAGASGFLSPAPGSVTVQAGADDKHWGPALPVEWHADTGAQASAYGTTTYRFPAPGTYWLRASYQGMTADSPVAVIDPKSAMIPRAGQKLIRTATPTDANHLAVNPICTRAQECPFHAVSLDAAMDMNRPLALIFATPALCETATCGPVLDTIVALSSQFAGKITFVHSEIFTALSRNAPNTPAVLAYHLQSEPLLFLADGTGTITERVDGLFGKAEATAALTRLVS